MPIQVWDYRREMEAEREEILGAVNKVLDSGRLILGASVRAFEEAFAAYCEAKHGIGVNSGTDALFLGLKALGVGPGDEVITVANTAIPTVSAIVSTGATPVFVDIEADTCLMDVTRLETAVTKKTKCILPVHLYGQCVDMAAVNAVAERHGLKVLEDCAQCTGALQNGRKAGSMSHVSAWSFYPTKNLGTYGDGGMVVTSDAEIDRRVRRLRMYGNEGTYYSVEHGYNSRLDEIHAEILLRKLKHLDDYVARRRQLAARYDRALRDSGLVLPVERAGNLHAYYVYVVRHPRRDQIMQALARREIVVNISYPWPIHTMKGYAHLGGKDGDLPLTEAAAKEVFSLPMYPALRDAEQDTVCTALHEILRHELQ